ncbi:hypothetical protein IVA94_37805 [Bradyrhizobium sp. 156]|uniref:hypothetical protein n=1 Tax=Bradyrhizobium sp. 156 TaxID=2782630 RepID=UPI001FF761B9|nr:hypothetical protein [Bradyrhizobium sp. 156]MCK1326483.1 hypothetical protein [Bradyrhizobium sp. 156]
MVSPESSCLCRLNSIEPPWYGPVCPVVWEGWRRETSPYPDQSRSKNPISGKSGHGKTPFPDSKSTAWDFFTDDSLSSVSTNGQGGRKIVETADQACTGGTSFAARIKTFNNKNVPIYGVSLTVR